MTRVNSNVFALPVHPMVARGAWWFYSFTSNVDLFLSHHRKPVWILKPFTGWGEREGEVYAVALQLWSWSVIVIIIKRLFKQERIALYNY